MTRPVSAIRRMQSVDGLSPLEADRVSAAGCGRRRRTRLPWEQWRIRRARTAARQRDRSHCSYGYTLDGLQKNEKFGLWRPQAGLVYKQVIQTRRRNRAN